MELAGTKTNAQYNYYINRLMADLQSVVESNTMQKEAPLLQRRLDRMADHYQDNELLGESRYKLYEAQALIFYFQNRDSEALKFIEEAVRVRGEDFESAMRLRTKLSAVQSEVKDEYKSIGGWLALLTTGIFITLLFMAYNGFTGIGTYSQLEPIFDMYPSLSGAMIFEIAGDFVVATISLIAFVLLLQRKKTAKWWVVVLLISAAVYGLVDYLWASSLFEGVAGTESELSKSSGGCW